MPRPRQPQAARRGYWSLNQSARWPELPEMATEQARFQSIFPFVVQYQKSAATNRAPAAVEKHIKTAVAALRNMESGGAPPHSKTQATGMCSKSRPRFGLR